MLLCSELNLTPVQSKCSACFSLLTPTIIQVGLLTQVPQKCDWLKGAMRKVLTRRFLLSENTKTLNYIKPNLTQPNHSIHSYVLYALVGQPYALRLRRAVSRMFRTFLRRTFHIRTFLEEPFNRCFKSLSHTAKGSFDQLHLIITDGLNLARNRVFLT